MALSRAQLAELAIWIQQFTQASDQLKTSAAQQAEFAWLAFEAWYDKAAVAALAAQMSDASVAAQQTSSGLSAAYVAAIVGAMSVAGVPSIPRIPFGDIRNGADRRLVHMRPAKAYRQAIALGKSHEEALAIAGNRAAGTTLSDITLQDREAQQKMLDALGITQYRRIIHPEMSRTGTCGLCVAASQRTYKTGELMPLHPPTCKCTVMPIIGADDPGVIFNDQDIAQLYDDAANQSKDPNATGTRRADRNALRTTRYTVHEHGELGPILTRAGDAFRDPSKVALENDVPRARRYLDQALPVLRLFEDTEGSGELYAAERLAFQRDFVARLEDIAA